MIYNENLGLSMTEIDEWTKQRISPFLSAPFAWKSEYLPIMIGVGGVSIIVIMIAIRKKNKKRKKK